MYQLLPTTAENGKDDDGRDKLLSMKSMPEVQENETDITVGEIFTLSDPFPPGAGELLTVKSMPKILPNNGEKEIFTLSVPRPASKKSQDLIPACTGGHSVSTWRMTTRSPFLLQCPLVSRMFRANAN
jgi:hypothetical protein